MMSNNSVVYSCINCKHDLLQTLELWLLRCPQCGLEQSLLYDESYNGANPIGWTESASDFLEQIRIENAEKILNKLAFCTELTEKKLLDIGCAAGWFLEVANRFNMQTVGLEPESNIAEKGIKKGLDIRKVCFPDDSISNEQYDVITFNDVFEHIKQPDVILDDICAQLNVDGYLVVNIPSSSGVLYLTARVLASVGFKSPLERLWQKGYFSPHLFYYSHNNLKQLVEKHGFKLVAKDSLDTIKINGLWERINHNEAMNTPVAVIMFLLIVCFYPLIKYVMPSDIMFHIYKKNN